MEHGSSQPPTPAAKDPRTIARKYQLDLCKRAVDENIIVYLGTGCGKTHIAVLLMYELGHLIRKPSDSVCVFLAPTVPLVRQQAMVIENCTDFKVQSYFGNRKHLKDHHEWNKEIEQVEVLVMTPQILLHNLRHRFIRMELIALLVFDECHHAQAQKRHPYAQIMKEFYKNDTPRSPRIFGMTASPIIGKGTLSLPMKSKLPVSFLLDCGRSYASSTARGTTSVQTPLLDAPAQMDEDRVSEALASQPALGTTYYMRRVIVEQVSVELHLSEVSRA